MAPIQYAGALQPKKKAELVDIANALGISNLGTKEDLQGRIKKHLEDNQSSLEEDPTFTGLFGKRRRSVQPPSSTTIQPAPGRFVPTTEMTTEVVEEVKIKATPSPKTRSSRRSDMLSTIREQPSLPEMADVSMMLKSPLSPLAPETPARIPPPEYVAVAAQEAEVVSAPSSAPSSAVPAQAGSPFSPRVIRELISNPNMEDLSVAVRRQHEQIRLSGSDLVLSTRAFLSNSFNIWSLTAVLEAAYIIREVVPWRYIEIPMTATPLLYDKNWTIAYPPPSTFTTGAFWSVLLHWAIPSLFLPILFGTLVSFNPNNTVDRRSSATPVLPFDPLTAAIVRLAAQYVYPYDLTSSGIIGADVIGRQWRVLNAALGVAFAFVEAIYKAPVFAQADPRNIQRSIEPLASSISEAGDS